MLFAMDLGVPNTGLILNDNDLVHVVQRMGISFSVDITRVAVDELLTLVHRKLAGHYAVLSTIPNVVGVTHEVTKAAKFCGRRIREVDSPTGCGSPSFSAAIRMTLVVARPSPR